MHIESAAVQYTDPKTNITKVYCGYDHKRNKEFYEGLHAE